MNVQTVRVDGLTCGHCANAVREEVGALTGVTDVTVELVAGATSTVTVTAETVVPADQLRAALAAAGDYTLAG